MLALLGAVVALSLVGGAVALSRVRREANAALEDVQALQPTEAAAERVVLEEKQGPLSTQERAVLAEASKLLRMGPGLTPATAKYMVVGWMGYRTTKEFVRALISGKTRVVPATLEGGAGDMTGFLIALKVAQAAATVLTAGSTPPPTI